MEFNRKSVLALLNFVSVATLLGCQKAAETSSPTAAVSSPPPANGSPSGTDKPETKATPNAEPDEPKPDANVIHPIFLIDTTVGKITIRLDAEKAPLTVENFETYVARGHYDQTIFHQIVKTPVQIVLGGVYTSDLKEKTPFTPIRNEADHALKNRRGTIAMLRRAEDEDSATCQFFFNISDNEMLNFKSQSAKEYGYCAFGEVTEGMDVLDQIANTPVHNSGSHVDLPVEPIAIRSIRQIK